MSLASRSKREDEKYGDNQMEIAVEDIISHHKTKEEAVKYLMKRYKVNFTKAFDIADKIYTKHKRNVQSCGYCRSLNNEIKGE